VDRLHANTPNPNTNKCWGFRECTTRMFTDWWFIAIALEHGSRWSTESFGELQRYSDDVVFLIGIKFISTISDLMQSALNCVQSWCDGVRLNDTNHKKEEFRRICRPKTLQQRFQTKQSGQVSGSNSRQ
jgi:hypothetical protein